jgi:hypothetical protein
MDLESSPGMRTAVFPHPASYHGLCFSERTRAGKRISRGQRNEGSSPTRLGMSPSRSQRSGMEERPRLRPCAMGTTIVYRRVSRISVSCTTVTCPLLCPAGQGLTLVEYRQERAGSVRVSYSAHLDDCCACQLHAHCQKRRTHRARRVSAVYWPLSSPLLPVPEPPPACSPVLWRDWPRRCIRRQWMNIVRSQSVTIMREPALLSDPSAELSSCLFTRSGRAHWRLSWEQRLARNARPASASPVTITLHGLPAAFAQIYGFELRNAS